MLSPFILHFLPITYFFVFFLSTRNQRNIRAFNKLFLLLFVITIVVALATYPDELNFDKSRYRMMYLSYLGESSADLEYKDIGWSFYVLLCGKMLGWNVDFYFIFTAAVYISGYYHFARHFFPKKTYGYFIVFAVGCLGFSAYGVNTIRAGIALSFFLHFMVLFVHKGTLWKYVAFFFAFCSILVHKSMIIPFSAFILSKYLKNNIYYVSFWLICFMASAINIDMSKLFDAFGFVDERVVDYIEGSNTISDYQSGFRIDFIIYSLVPMAFWSYYRLKKNIDDIYTSHLVRMYLFSNAIWLLAIRIHYTDRLAYLSWFMIPMILLLPIFNYQGRFKSPQNAMLLVMAVFMTLPILLLFR